jgi:hypothetical protein
MKNKVWAFGGSIIGGIDLPEKTQAYSYILAKELELDIVNYGKPATGTRYAFELLLQSNIQSGDIVLLDTTLPEWIRFHRGDEVKNLRMKDLKDYELQFWSDDQIFDEHTTIVNAFVKYTQLLNVKFNVHSFLPDWHPLWVRCKEYYQELDNYLELFDQVEDYADKEKLHPGVKTNIIVAEKMMGLFK